ncbi:protein kinase [Streptomyces sp. A7024]|uniref:non-specific serine/threonine protein kinase n=1 Tax=Streptomyces coryli TaxID=1128680 RepID=A0A6G4UD38_9ACTN|nr:protein kinase [Streptomyces coryli]NGN70084.1 protein kinase [Streptomyces coryli]
MSGDGAETGEVIDGRYELLELLGAGGMGEVWRARDTRLGREVAVKVFAPPRGTDAAEHAEMLARFDREARAVAALESPYVVALHDHGTAEVGGREGVAYLVMALVRGRTLERVLKDDGRVPYEKALTWAEQICRALATAHAAGVVHRDIKPANVMVADDDTVKVLDFGIARFVEAAALDQWLTRTGALPFGSVLYMAPERFRDDAGDARTDLYAVGCVLYELLVGRPPYVGSSAQVMYNHLNDTPLRPSRAVSGLPAAVDRLVLALMARDPEDRPADAETAAEAIREAGQRQEPSPVPEEAPVSEAAPASEKTPELEKTPALEKASELEKTPPHDKRPEPAPSPLSIADAPKTKPHGSRRKAVFSIAAVIAAMGSLVAIGLAADDPAPHDPEPHAPTASKSPVFSGTYSIGTLTGHDDLGNPEDEDLPEAVERAVARSGGAGAGIDVTGVDSAAEPDRWVERKPGLIGVVGDDPMEAITPGSPGDVPAIIRTCRAENHYDPDVADPAIFRVAATETDMGKGMARHLAAQPGVRKVYVRGDSDSGSTRALIETLRAAKIDVRIEHVSFEKESVALLRKGIREYAPDAVYLQADYEEDLTAWAKAVDATGFTGPKAAWDPEAPLCSGELAAESTASFPDGWLSPRGYYSAVRDPDRKHAEQVQTALDSAWQVAPYTAEEYDATLAMLAAWARVPKSVRTGNDPELARSRLTSELSKVKPKGLLTGAWTTLADAQAHPPVWVDRRDGDKWRQVKALHEPG